MTSAVDDPFTPGQQEYLKGFMAGVEARRAVTGQPLAPVEGAADPTDPHRAAQDRTVAAGGKLTGEEEAKRKKHPLDRFDEIAAMAGEPRFPIAFSAVQVADGFGIPAGVYYRLGLGGITGHRDFAHATDVIVRPDDATRVAAAMVRVFIAEGDRTDRSKARLKYVLDRMGLPRFLAAMEEVLGAPLLRVDPAAILPRPMQDKHGHIGVHAQKQPCLNYVGVVVPIARLSAPHMRGLAAIADRFGSGTLRLTVWQNLLISDIPDAALDDALAAIADLGLTWRASGLRGGLVACTGNTGCKFSASDTKRHAAELVEWLDARVAVDQPLNIHLTGCHHSCAQHYVADIGLLATKIEDGDEMIEGYDLLVGGGAGARQALGRLIRPQVKFADLPPMIRSLLIAWQESRDGAEDFQSWTARMTDVELASLVSADMMEVG